MDGAIKWIRETEIYKDDKLWDLLLILIPVLAGVIGYIIKSVVDLYKIRLEHKNLLLKKEVKKNELALLKMKNKHKKKKK